MQIVSGKAESVIGHRIRSRMAPLMVMWIGLIAIELSWVAYCFWRGDREGRLLLRVLIPVGWALPLCLLAYWNGMRLLKKDLTHAMEYYDRASPGLGREFLTEVERTVQHIVLDPNAWKRVSAHSRRCRMRRFPYGLFYSIHRDEIVILGIMDLRRHPDSWKTRIQGSSQKMA